MVTYRDFASQLAVKPLSGEEGLDIRRAVEYVPAEWNDLSLYSPIRGLTDSLNAIQALLIVHVLTVQA